MSEGKMFSPERETKETKDKKEKKEQVVKSFIRKVEARVDFSCLYDDCGKKIKKGEECWLVLTQRDINEHMEAYPNERPVPSRMCEDCMDKKIVRDKEGA